MSMLVGNNQIPYEVYRNNNKDVSSIGQKSEETMEEYKKRINQEIENIPFHSSHKKIKETLVISEEGYQAMKDNKEYEKWVLEHIRENRSVDMSLMTRNKEYISGTDYEFIGGSIHECWGRGDDVWDFSNDPSGSAMKKKKKSNNSNDSYNPNEIWEQAKYRRACIQEERDKEYFLHKRELTQMNYRLAEKCYDKNFLFESN